MATPSSHQFLDGISPNINHPFWVSPFLGNFHISTLIFPNVILKLQRPISLLVPFFGAGVHFLITGPRARRGSQPKRWWTANKLVDVEIYSPKELYDRITPHDNSVFGQPTVEYVNETEQKTIHNEEKQKGYQQEEGRRGKMEVLQVLHLPLFDDVV